MCKKWNKKKHFVQTCSLFFNLIKYNQIISNDRLQVNHEMSLKGIFEWRSSAPHPPSICSKASVTTLQYILYSKRMHGSVVLCEGVQGRPRPDPSLPSRQCLFLIWAGDLWRSPACVYLLTSFHFSNGLCSAGW